MWDTAPEPNLQDSEVSDKQAEKTTRLNIPIKHGKAETTEIVLHKPHSGVLRGIRLQAIVDMDVNAVIIVIPCVSSSVPIAQEAAEMDPADLTTIPVEVVTFLLRKSVPTGLPTA